MKTLLMALLLAVHAFAATLRVPGEYPTIQSALNALGARDTVLVDTGVYAEALIAPPLSFSMIGTRDSSATDPGGTIIDPTSLENPTERACLTVSADTALVQGFVFRNGAAMYPHSPDTSGGIQHSARLLELRDCIFDSTHRSVQGFEPISTRLFACRFLHSYGACILTMPGSVHAYDCFFQCDSADWGVALSSGKSHYERCHFAGYWGSWTLWLRGQSAVVRNCLFDPPGPAASQVMYIRVNYAVVEGNQFIGTQRTSSVISLGAHCPGEIVIRNNLFFGVRPIRSRFGATCLNLLVDFEHDSCDETSTARVSENLVINWDSPNNTKAILLAGHGISIEHNRFVDLDPPSSPAISIGVGRATLRDNIFENTGLAVYHAPDLPGEADAAFNWWGDSTGPYHPTLNPNGLGDEVSDRVLFEPWHTDTLFFADVPDRSPPSVASAALQVFPNPFNVSATLRLYLPKPEIVRVELFDLLGRRVQELFVGPVAYTKTLTVSGEALASGIYFARVQNTITRQTVALSKLALVK